MVSLERTKIGCFHIEDSFNLEDLSAESLDESLQPMSVALRHFSSIQLVEEQIPMLANGVLI